MAKLTPRLPNVNDPVPTDGDLVYGDSQADLTGLTELLKKAQWNPDKQRLFSIGDNIDRGPKAKEMLDFMDQYGIGSIQGNHDWKFARYGFHQINSAVTGSANPIKPNIEMQDTLNQLGPDYLKYAQRMKDYPLYLPFEDSQGKGYLMHGGPHPKLPIEQQDPNMMLVRRQHPHPPKFQRKFTPEYPAWQDSYDGDLGTILHGHNGTPTADFHKNPHVISLDGSGSIGRHALNKDDMPGWHGHHRLVRLGDRKIFESPGSEESEKHYTYLINLGAYSNMQV
jgi:hypothetical protein